jgi:hypothetical protein
MQIVNWRGQELINRVRARIARNLQPAAQLLQRAERKEVSVPGPPRSRPGEAPHIDTSDLIQSIDYLVDFANLELIVAPQVEYAWYLEHGTPNMAPRPFIVSTFVAEGQNVARRVLKV